LVSSGAVAEGASRLGFRERPKAIHELQAAAAVGQMGLIQAWETAFQGHGLRTALVLLTHDDLSNRQRYLNARITLRTLLELGVVPVINENDTVATDEIRFGDNDTLAALVTNLVEAHVLVLLTDRDGLYESDPELDPTAALVQFSRANDARLVKMAGSVAGSVGVGGMATKVGAARVAARSGARTIIANGATVDVLRKLRAGETVGTLLAPDVEVLLARKRWIAGQLKTKGELVLDAGAVEVLRHGGKSLLAVGVTAARGKFARGDVVLCVDPDSGAVAKGLVNYASDETQKILGCATRDIEGRLGFVREPELMHRDNLVLL
ncbi:MAG: glutamate 5-kinase, partial [Proteobacteria bacterium]|nr:glutamate 5-kinase [Pseudomonadota bacterium]